MLLSVRNISKSHALRTLFDGVSLVIDEGDRLGLIGPNGAGKSTLLRLMADYGRPAGAPAEILGGLDAGEVVAAKGLRAAYIAQQERFDEQRDARHILIDAAMHGPEQDASAGAIGDAGGAAPSQSLGLAPGPRPLAPALRDHHEAEFIAELVLERLGFDRARAQTPAGSLSGGWRKRLSIARGLAACGGTPDLLLLDEPTNHLDLDGIRWLEEFLRSSLGTDGSRFASVFVTHDRTFLENVATSIVELSTAYPSGTLRVRGNYTEFLRRKQEFLEAQGKAEQSLAGQVKKDLAWLARGAKARRTKSKSRIESSHERMDMLATLRGRNDAANATGARVDFTATGRKTRKLIEAKGIAKSLGGRQLFSDVWLALGVGDCLGLLGPNGGGKTTLIRVLTGELAPDAGEVVRSDPPPTVAVFSQHRQEFAPTTLLRDALNPPGDKVWFRGQAMHITAWSRRFLFRDEQLDQAIRTLSGGELARVHIARIMLAPSDVLVLDEPTNDLDIPTLETLEEALEDFPGAIVLVTHDRAMLDRLATDVLALDGRGNTRMLASVDQAVEWWESQARDRSPDSARPGGSESKDADGPVAAGSSPVAAASPAPPQRKKLSYHEQREYDAIERRIIEAEAAAADAESHLSDPGVVADHARMAAACRTLEQAQAQVAALYARWEELEAKRG